MVKLADVDIKTKEVLDWKGLHVFHHPISSCSQKTRIFLNLKGVDWESHVVDLLGNANVNEWFLGINPRGLVPVLVDNGDVHIESNDILTYLENKFDSPKLIPEGAEEEVAELLKLEDNLHFDLRALSFRFVFAPPVPPKTPDVLVEYAKNGSGTVGGEKDDHLDAEIAFWERLNREGITDEVARAAAANFKKIFSDLDGRLESKPYILGDELTVLDIAWFIYVNRLKLAGYPYQRLHPNLAAWFDRLAERPEFAREIVMPPPMLEKLAATHAKLAEAGQTLEEVAGF